MLTRVFIGLERYSFVGKLHQELLIFFFSDKMPDSRTEPRNNAEKVPKRNVPDKVAKNAPEKTTKTAQVQSLQPQSVAPSVAATSSKPARKNQETKVTKWGDLFGTASGARMVQITMMEMISWWSQLR